MTAAEAVRLFLDGAPPPGEALPALPLSLEMDPTTWARAADVAILLGLIGGAYALARVLARRGGPHPATTTASFAALLMFLLTDPLLWQLARLDLDDAGITMRRHVMADVHLSWDQVHSVRFDGGRLLPLVADDAALVLEGPDGRQVRVPRYLPNAALAAAWIARKVPPPGPPAQERPR